MDHYAILGVLPTAEDVVIRAAFKALAQRYHPDRFTGAKEEAHRRMAEIKPNTRDYAMTTNIHPLSEVSIRAREALLRVAWCRRYAAIYVAISRWMRKLY